MGDGLSRREVLRAGLAGLAFFAAGPGPWPGGSKAEQRRRAVSLYTGRGYPTVATTCGMCPTGCGILVSVDGRDIVGIKGNPDHPYNRGRICALGSAGLNLFDDPQRISTPLRRVGGRGEGKWKAITWAEAVAEIASRVRKARSGTGRDAGGGRWAFVISREESGNGWFLRRFLSALGEAAFLVEAGSLEAPADEEAHRTVCGFEAGMADFAHADTVLNFGADLFGSPRHLVGCSQRLLEARRRRGTYLVTLDPRHSATASSSDEWIPLRPGTDGLVALAVAKVMVEEGLADRAFLARNADADAARLEEALEGLDIRRAADASGVDVLTITTLARRFAGEGRRGVAVYGGGVLGHEIGCSSAQCVLLLNVLAGNLDRKGGYVRAERHRFGELAPEPPARHLQPLQGTLFQEIDRGGRSIEGLFTFEANPAYEDPAAGRTRAILESEEAVPFHVVMDSCMSETALLADLVVPSSTYLERWGLFTGSLPGGEQYVSLRQPVVPPRGESKTLEEVLAALADQLGGDVQRYVRFGDGGRYYEGLVRNSGELESVGGWQLLRERGVLSLPRREGLGVVPAGEGVAGAGEGRKARCVVLPAIAWGIGYLESLPSRRHQSGEKTLLIFSTPVHGSKTAGCKWLAEIEHCGLVWMHPDVANCLGCREGDRVRLRSAEGAIEARVRLTQGIYPGAVAMSGAAGHTGFGPYAAGEPFKSEDPDSALVWWGKDLPGHNPRLLVSWSRDPRRMGPRWMDTAVTLEKL